MYITLTVVTNRQLLSNHYLIIICFCSLFRCIRAPRNFFIKLLDYLSKKKKNYLIISSSFEFGLTSSWVWTVAFLSAFIFLLLLLRWWFQSGSGGSLCIVLNIVSIKMNAHYHGINKPLFNYLGRLQKFCFRNQIYPKVCIFSHQRPSCHCHPISITTRPTSIYPFAS